MGTVSVSATARPATAGQGARISVAFAALVLFFTVYCARPEDWLHFLAPIPLAKITGALALVALLMTLGSLDRRRLPREMLYVALLTAQLWLTVPFSPVWRGGAFWATLGFSKLLLILPMMLIAASTLPRLRGLIFVQAGSAALVAVVSIIEQRRNVAMAGGRLFGAAGSFYDNPNELATALAIALPFCLVFALRKNAGWRRWLWVLPMLAMVYTVFLTESRAGLLALVVSAGVCVWEFGVRGGRRYLPLLAAGAGLVLVLVAGKGLEERFAATFGSEVSTQAEVTAYASAMERRALLTKSIEVSFQHPLFGVGLNNFEVISGHWKVTHNSYTQLSAEGGFAALILFLMILWRAFANLREAKQLANKDSEEYMWACALRASLLGFVLASFFDSLAVVFFPYFLLGYTSILRELVSSPETSGPKPVPEKRSPTSAGDLFRLGRTSTVSGA